MTYSIRITPDAEAQFYELEPWWRENRATARSLRELFERALALISGSPGVGQQHLHPRIGALRRFHLRPSPYLIYYAVDDDRREIAVLAIWSGEREEGPPLRLS